ncbi:DUF563 domain-containing protein [Stappia sp. GBMRC 2046]|uniref:DUF563 domain-containing protein n=1 Tax=Stappia sediminis TaxID=2692190 RepID=A0A7X3LWF6_9HYPH|nr:glycosyltransferase 61 family protein [Stappia sediminis]MXN66372.1 DUF563 domain-containing protein [Stappia sediminis]
MSDLMDKIFRFANGLFSNALEGDIRKNKRKFELSANAGNLEYISEFILYTYEGELGVECNSGEILQKFRILKNRPRMRKEFFRPQIPSIPAILKKKGRAFDSIVAVNHALPADFRTLCLVVFANRTLFELSGIPEGTPLFVSLKIGALPHMQDALEAGYFLPGATLMTWQREFVKADKIYELDFQIPSKAVILKTSQRMRNTFDISAATENSVVFMLSRHESFPESEFVEELRKEKLFDAHEVRFIDPDQAKLGDIVESVANATCVIGPTSPYLAAAIFRLPEKPSLIEITEDGKPTAFNKELICSLDGKYLSTSKNVTEILSAIKAIHQNRHFDKHKGE